MRWLRARVGWLLVALPVLAIVVGFLVLRSWSGRVITTDDGKVLVSKRPTSGMDALSGGRLRFVGGCLGASDYVIVWPHGTTVVDEHPITVKVPDYGTLSLGDRVRIGGGFLWEPSEGRREPGPRRIGGVTVPAKCAEHAVFLAH